MTTEQDFPSAIVIGISVGNRRDPNRRIRAVKVKCPLCGKTHTHGWPMKESEETTRPPRARRGQVLGHRVAHCVEKSAPHGYYIVLPNEAAYPFPPLQDYVFAHRCPTCRAVPGAECNAPRKNHRQNLLNRQHLSRWEAGVKHCERDERKAPPPEERVPGLDYSTVKRVPLPAGRPDDIPEYL